MTPRKSDRKLALRCVRHDNCREQPFERTNYSWWISQQQSGGSPSVVRFGRYTAT